MDPNHELETLRRQVEENTHMIGAIDDILRGRGDELGLVAWVMVLRRTWITLVALLSAAIGYLLNDVVDGFQVGAMPNKTIASPLND
jgi:hypothetical protein